MDEASERLVREFVLVANALMNRIPRPVPEGPQRGPWSSVLQDLGAWDGELLDVRALHHAYNRLPAAVQEMVVSGYRQCLQVLAQQHHTAMSALSARVQVLADVMAGTGLAPEQLVPDIHGDGFMQADLRFDTEAAPGSLRPEPGPMNDAVADDAITDNAVADPPLRLVPPITPIDDDISGALIGHRARRWMRRALHTGAVAASLVAVSGIGHLAWQHVYTPSAPSAADHRLPGDTSLSSRFAVSVAAPPPVAPPADDAGLCVLSPDADAAWTTDRPASTPTDDLHERDATWPAYTSKRPYSMYGAHSMDDKSRDRFDGDLTRQ